APRRIFRLVVNSTTTPQLAFLQANPNETPRPGSARSFDTTPVAAGVWPVAAPGPAGLCAPAEPVGCADEPPGWSLPIGDGELEGAAWSMRKDTAALTPVWPRVSDCSACTV